MEITDWSTNTINGQQWYCNYRNMKKKYRQPFDDETYYQMAMNVLLSMFEYDERIFHPDEMEMILHDYGICALIKTDVSEFTPAICNLVGGDRYPDGTFKNAFCILLDGSKYTFENWLDNPDVCIFFNNRTRTPDMFIEKYAYLLTNCDTSLDCNILFSRKKPVPIARDKKTKNQIDAIFSDLDNGVYKTIITEPTVSDLIGESGKPIEVLNISEVESSRYIQYLSQLHDNLISRLFFHMGLSMSDINKQAQVTQAELNKNKSASLAFIESWKVPRQEAINEIKRKRGIELKFKLSDIWKSELDAQINPDGQENKEAVSSPNAESEESKDENG